MHVILAILAMDLTAQVYTIDYTSYPEYDTVHLHFNERRQRQIPAVISSILVKEIKIIYSFLCVHLRCR